nr:MAG TPA: major capsid protein [Caudoviricetes sp.]
MTFHYGQDGRLDFYDQSDAELKSRRSELVTEGHLTVQSDPERARACVSHIRAIDNELAGRKERRGGSSKGGARKFDGTGQSGNGFGPDESKGAPGFLTGASIKGAADALADKIATDREGKSLLATGGTEVHVVDPGLQPLGRPASVLDVVPVIGASAPQIRYMRQTSRVNNAAVVAAGETKPTSTYGVTPVDRTRKVLAHLSEPIQEYDLLDVPALKEFVNTELDFGLVKALETELFYGNGDAAHLHGIAQESGVQTVAFAGNIFAVTRRAITAVTSLGYNPSVFVMSPADLEAIDLAVTSGSGEFVNKSGPFDPAEAKLWGVPVVVSTSLAPKEAYLLSDDSVRIYADVQARIRVEWARSGDDFETNAVRARLEGRFEVGVSRPEGVVKIATAA